MSEHLAAESEILWRQQEAKEKKSSSNTPLVSSAGSIWELEGGSTKTDLLSWALTCFAFCFHLATLSSFFFLVQAEDHNGIQEDKFSWLTLLWVVPGRNLPEIWGLQQLQADDVPGWCRGPTEPQRAESWASQICFCVCLGSLWYRQCIGGWLCCVPRNRHTTVSIRTAKCLLHFFEVKPTPRSVGGQGPSKVSRSREAEGAARQGIRNQGSSWVVMLVFSDHFQHAACLLCPLIHA